MKEMTEKHIREMVRDYVAKNGLGGGISDLASWLRSYIYYTDKFTVKSVEGNVLSVHACHPFAESVTAELHTQVTVKITNVKSGQAMHFPYFYGDAKVAVTFDADKATGLEDLVDAAKVIAGNDLFGGRADYGSILRGISSKSTVFMSPSGETLSLNVDIPKYAYLVTTNPAPGLDNCYSLTISGYSGDLYASFLLSK